MAPESDIILVGTNLFDTSIIDGVQYIVNQAKAAGKPCVINLSLGSDTGPHDGTSLSDMALDQLCGEGAVIVGSAGNSGDSPIHLHKQFTGEGMESIATMLIPRNYSNRYLELDIWGRTNSAYSINVKLYDPISGSYIQETGPYAIDKPSGKKTLISSTQEYHINFYNNLYPSNNCYNCYLFIEPTTTTSSFNNNEMFVVEVMDDDNNVVHMWTNSSIATLASNGVRGLTDGDSNYTVCEIGATGKQIISVGAYATKLNWTDVNGTHRQYTAPQELYKIAVFSGLGPTADNRIKPDIVAPGYGVVSGFNSWNDGYKDSNPRTVAKRKFNGRNYYWGMQQGTSMSTPVVTGTIALWLEANPKLTQDMIREIFRKTAASPTNLRSNSQNNTYGWGKLDGFEGLNEAIDTGIAAVNADINEAITISPNPSNGQFSINTQVAFTKVQVNDLSGRTLYQNELNTPQQNHNVAIEKMISGIYTISIFTENDVVTSKVIIY